MPESRPKLPQAPPKPPPSSGSLEIDAGPVSRPDMGLDEVETALSLLDGRHPEFVKAEREKAEAMARRRRELEIAASRDRKRARVRSIVGAVLALAIGGTAWFARERYEHNRRALDGSAALAKSFAPLGFAEVVPATWARPDRLEVPLPSGTCAIALGAESGKPVTIEVTHDGDTLEAQGSFGFCTCASETVVVAAKGGTSGLQSVRLLRTDARQFGSVLGFARAPVKPAAVDRCACMEDQLDGWLGGAGGSEMLKPPDAAWIAASPARASLALAGVHVVHGVAPDASLFPLAVAAGTCAIAVPSDPADTLALRAKGGALPLDAGRGTLALCSQSARTYGVWHEGRGAVTILHADAARVGARSELGAIAQRGGLGTPRLWIEPEDLAWDAAAALATAHVAPATSMELAPGTRLPAEARIVAFSLSSGGTIEPTSGDGIACEHAAPGAPTLLCVDVAPAPWHEASGKARAGVAYAPLPIWMKPLAAAPAATSAVLSLVTLARKLGAQRFEPIALEGVTETHDGAIVLGRAGEDAVVAVTVQPVPPFVLPLGERGGWDIAGEPNVVPLAPGKKIALRSSVLPGGPEEARRTVVFRRAEGEPKK